MWINCSLEEFVNSYTKRHGRQSADKNLVGLILAPGHLESVKKDIIPSLGYIHSISDEALHFYAAGYKFEPKPEKLEDFPNSQPTFSNPEFATTIRELGLIFDGKDGRKKFRYTGKPSIVLCLIDLDRRQIDPAAFKTISLAPTIAGKPKFEELVHKWERDVKIYSSEEILHVAKTSDDLINFTGGLTEVVKWAFNRIGIKL